MGVVETLRCTVRTHRCLVIASRQIAYTVAIMLSLKGMAAKHSTTWCGYETGLHSSGRGLDDGIELGSL